MYRERYPEYKGNVQRLIKGRDYIVVTDDMDSTVSLALMRLYNPKIKIVGVVNNYKGVFLDINHSYKSDKTIGVDITLCNKDIPSISNHVENVMYKKYSKGVSVNDHITHNYTSKNVFSTSLLLWASLGLPLPKSDEGKIALLCIDSTFLGYYGGYRDELVGYLHSYGLEGLIDILERYEREDFERYRNTFLLSSTLFYDWDRYRVRIGDSHSDYILDLLGLPKINEYFEYRMFIPTTVEYCNVKYFRDLIEKTNGRYIITYARTFNDRVAYSRIDWQKKKEIII